MYVPLRRDVPVVLARQGAAARLLAEASLAGLVDWRAAVQVSAQRLVRRAHHLVFRVPDLALQQVLFSLLMQGLPANTPCVQPPLDDLGGNAALVCGLLLRATRCLCAGASG